MPFDEKEDQTTYSQNIGLKKVSTQKSIFDGLPKKPTQEEFDKNINKIQERMFGYKAEAAELALQFSKAMNDKTLKQNKNIFSLEIEQEILSKMVQLAIKINNDPIEQEGMGSLSWITLLLKACFSQRDRINYLEYTLSQFEKKFELIVSELKEINHRLTMKVSG